MSRQFLGQLDPKQSVSEIYLASNKQLRSNRNGNLYLQVDLSDRTGQMAGLMWNASENDYKGFENGDYVQIGGTVQLYQGGLQLIVSSIAAVPAGKVDEDDFIRLGAKKVDELAGRVAEMLRAMKNPHLRNLADCYLMDEDFMKKFCRAPAGIKNHHAYHGGLLEHVMSVMSLVDLVKTHYPQIDADLLLVGAFLHDVGKIDELGYERDLSYTDEGQMIGHLVMAVGLLERKVIEAERLSGEPIPEELVLRVKHMIVSHHGEYAYGSPKLPMTLEAIALHHLDNLDAKVHSFEKIIADDPNVDSSWTAYVPNLGRKLFKGTKEKG
jgi:3'-5' exoribonuclease